MAGINRLRKSPESMLTEPPLKSIFFFGLPILFGNVFQQLYSMVDSIVVGNFVGTGALAAVGSSATVCSMLLMACWGFSNGASIVIAQLFGAGKRKEIKTTISTTLIFSVIFAICMSIASWWLLPVIARLINIPDDIIADAITYMRIYGMGLVFLMLYNFFAGVLRALGDSVTPLIFLIISSLLNIVGDLFFVVNLHMGVAGVAIATDLAQAISVILCVIYVSRKSEYFRFKKGEFRFSGELFRLVMRMGIPSAIQGSVSHLGFILVQRLVNSFSTVNIAAYTAANKMESFSMLPVSGFTQAFAVYAGQNIGAGDFERTKDGMKKTIIFLTALCFAVSGLIYVIGPQLIGMFVDDSETVVISRGAAYLRAFCPFLVFHALMQIFSSLLRGAGDSVMTMISSFVDLGVRTLMAYALSLWLNLGFMGCAWAIPCGWFCAMMFSFIRYKSGKWKNKAVAGKTAEEPA